MEENRVAGSAHSVVSSIGQMSDDIDIPLLNGESETIARQTGPKLDQQRNLQYTGGEYKENPFNCKRSAFSKPFGLCKMLFRWRSSIWQSTLAELFVYLVFFMLISATYRLVLTDPQKRVFEKISLLTTWNLKNITCIPLGLVLGFYVTTVYNRWWGMWNTLPWPDRFAILASSTVLGDDSEGSLIRRSMVRYLNLSFAFSAIGCGKRMRKVYPTLQDLVDAGLMTQGEKMVIKEAMSGMLQHNSSWWIPMTWCSNLIIHAQEQGRIKNDRMVQLLMTELLAYRQACAHMFDFDMVGVPLIYTQVVTLAVYTFFALSLVGFSQYLDPSQGLEGNQFDLYFPVFSALLFIVMVGWLKVAGKMLNPYGDGDGDFMYDVVWILHRNVEVGNHMVDDAYNFFPPLEWTVPLTGTVTPGRKFDREQLEKLPRKRTPGIDLSRIDSVQINIGQYSSV
mmetsp:Transcript_11869/g.16084  ORF Transcript_11869/g.16084 Transcript_11869/m.16084 type:complete len:451 (+) Transcript_11869:74-1426(+)|eukprot:CAMPEP_0196583794 /NCGR_PEP_ID=MMETSP1081-20130531/44712_1 /TAXON_ID=36882 /ORGANISM="Pyramimonas amylifera, Strain CCMP720" /LENGTH=450 /DNA_ID=CAMNT_0041904787 /DNA_START=73 /DNA_END=1425 /DNA_ORIENTATION=+